MKILTFIPAYKRRAITALCYGALRRAIQQAPEWLDIQVLCVVSNEPDKRLAIEMGFDAYMAANKPLGRKFNAGLEYAFQTYSFDYLFQMNSDNILHLNFWKRFEPFLKQERPFFGCNHIGIYDSETGRLFKYLYGTGCGIRFIRIDILHGAAYQVLVDNPQAEVGTGFTIHQGKVWIPQGRYRARYGQPIGTRFQLWTLEKNRGLDFDSEKQIRFAFSGPEYRQRFPINESREPLIVDIKSAENIHPISEFEADDMAQEVTGAERERILDCFPEIKAAYETV